MKRIEKIFKKSDLVFSLIVSFIFTFFYYYCIIHNLVFLPLIISTFFIAFQVGFLIVSNRIFRLKTDVEYLELQKSTLQQQRSSYQLAESKIQKKLKDAQHLLKNIDLALSENRVQDASDILNNTGELLNSSNYTSYCDNKIIDIILHSKELECQQNGIHFYHNILIPDSLDIPSSKLISLFFNLLNNGIEACKHCEQENPVIALSIDYRGDFLFISMENSKAITITFDHNTTKDQPFYHGFGLSIIEEIVQELDGFCKWEDKNHSFHSTLMLRYHNN